MIDKKDPHVQQSQIPRSEGPGAATFAKKKVGGGLDAFVIESENVAAKGAQAMAEAARAARNHYMPAYDADVVSGDQRDLLGIELDVNAMAALVTARDINPPLSIGLFGDWGTGKTFFMDRMQARVARIGRSGGAGFCSGVVQIRFNAWHYVEANLWASLIDTIFRSLEEAVLGSEDGDAQLEILRARWQSALDEQAQAEHELEAVAERLEQAQAERDRLREEKQEAERKALEVREMGEEALPTVSDVSEEMARQLPSLLRLAGRELGLDKLGDEARKIASRPIDEALETLDQAHILRDRALTTWRAFASSGVTPRQVILAIIALLLPVGTVALLAYVQGEAIRAWLAQPLTVLAEIAVMVGTATQWVRGRIRRANQLVDRLDEVRGELTKARDQELEKRHEALELAEAQVSALAEELDAKQSEVDELAARQAAARRELDEFTPAKRMATFLSERVASDDYRKHLGLIALIRRDLQRLSELLAMQDGAATEDGARTLPSVQRIVLYIDDLDRCAPDRVVELLQAIHLLLAFPLFVVVVAVDARWVSRALVSHYPELLDHSEDDPTPSGQATSHDYLEKIFQIPFWIEPMSAQGSSSMIAGLLEGEGKDTGAPAGGDDDDDDDAALEADAARLEIKPEERDAMLALAGIAGRSPRAVKRFINVYRLIKASMSASELAEFEPDAARKRTTSPGYVATLLTLAVAVGYPHIADDLFAAIEQVDPGDAPLSSLVATLQARYPGQAQWTSLLAQIQRYLARSSAGTEPTIAEVRRCAAHVARYSFRIVPR
jgi:predicted  nucleic acid-binding Zn-ribbon protein